MFSFFLLWFLKKIENWKQKTITNKPLVRELHNKQIKVENVKSTLDEIISEVAIFASLDINVWSAFPLLRALTPNAITWNNPAILPNLCTISTPKKKDTHTHYTITIHQTQLQQHKLHKILPGDHHVKQQHNNQAPKEGSCNKWGTKLSSKYNRVKISWMFI